MWWYGRGNSGGSLLREEKKANMWYGRGNSGSSWPTAFPRTRRKEQTERNTGKLQQTPAVSFPLVI